MNLGEKLFELRKSKNLSQEDVAEKLNVTRQTVSKWETNQSTPDFDKIIPLCDLFEISTDELLRGKKTEEVNEEKQEENAEPEKVMTRNEARKKMGEVTSTSILMYIVALVVFIVVVTNTNIDATIAIGLLLIICGYATARIVKCSMSLPKFEELKEDKEENQILKSISCIIWCVIVFIYFVISFSTMMWHITWLIFIIGAIINEIAKLVFLLKEAKKDEE